MDISIPYYEDRTRISNSNIGWFLNKGPAYLHKMLTEDVPEEKNPVLERGTMIHEYLLQPEEFQKDYVLWDKTKPFSAQQEKFCQELANTVEIEPDKAIISAYKEAYSTAGKSEDKMLSEGLKIASTLKDYIDFLKQHDGRIIISPSEYQMLKKIKYNVLAHKLAQNLLWPTGYNNTKDQKDLNMYFGGNKIAYHEFHINWDIRIKDTDKNTKDIYFLTVQCKSLLDGLTLDFKNKKAIIYDLKTTAKLWHFEESIDTYDYLRQLAYYTMAVEWYLVKERGQAAGDWTFEYYIIGIDTTGTSEIRVFKIEPYMVQSRNHTICDALGAIAWHQSTGKWEHSREYYEGDGSETLSL